VEFFSQTFFSTQLANPSVAPQKAIGGTFDHSAIDEVFMKAIRVPNLTVGIIYFLSKHIAATASEGGDDGSNVVTEACQAAIDTLRSGLDVTRSL
jgi:nucleolar MIF4G domain-containing protein 1